MQDGKRKHLKQRTLLNQKRDTKKENQTKKTTPVAVGLVIQRNIKLESILMTEKKGTPLQKLWNLQTWWCHGIKGHIMKRDLA